MILSLPARSSKGISGCYLRTKLLAPAKRYTKPQLVNFNVQAKLRCNFSSKAMLIMDYCLAYPTLRSVCLGKLRKVEGRLSLDFCSSEGIPRSEPLANYSTDREIGL